MDKQTDGWTNLNSETLPQGRVPIKMSKRDILNQVDGKYDKNERMKILQSLCYISMQFDNFHFKDKEASTKTLTNIKKNKKHSSKLCFTRTKMKVLA